MSTPTSSSSTQNSRPGTGDSGMRSGGKQSIPPLPTVQLPGGVISRVSSNNSSLGGHSANRTPLIPPLPTPPLPVFEKNPVKSIKTIVDDDLSAYSSESDSDELATARIKYKSNPTSGQQSQRDLNKAQNEGIYSQNNSKMDINSASSNNSQNNVYMGAYTVDIKVRSKNQDEHILSPKVAQPPPVSAQAAVIVPISPASELSTQPAVKTVSQEPHTPVSRSLAPSRQTSLSSAAVDPSSMLFVPQNMRTTSESTESDWSSFRPDSENAVSRARMNSTDVTAQGPVEDFVHSAFCHNLVSSSAVSIPGLAELILEPSLDLLEDGKYHLEVYRVQCTKAHLVAKDLQSLLKPSDGKPPTADQWQNTNQTSKYKHGVCMSSGGTLAKTKDGLILRQAIPGAVPIHYIATDALGSECSQESAEYLWQRVYIQVLPSNKHDNFNATHNLSNSLATSSDRIHLPLVRIPLRLLNNHLDAPVLLMVTNTQKKSIFRSDAYKPVGSIVTSTRRLLDWPSPPITSTQGNEWTPISQQLPPGCSDCHRLQLLCPRSVALYAGTPQRPQLPFIDLPDLSTVQSQTMPLLKNATKTATLHCAASLVTVMHPSTTHLPLCREEFVRVLQLAKKHGKTLGNCNPPPRFLEQDPLDSYFRSIESLPRPDCSLMFDVRCNLPSQQGKTVLSVSCLTKGNHVLANLFTVHGNKPTATSMDLFGSTMNEMGTSKGGDSLTIDPLASRKAFKLQGYDIYNPQSPAQHAVAGHPTKYKGKSETYADNLHIQRKMTDPGALLRLAEREWRLVALSGVARELSPNHAPKFGTMQMSLDQLTGNKTRRAIQFTVHSQNTGEVIACASSSVLQLVKHLLKTSQKAINHIELELHSPDGRSVGSVFLSDVALHTPVDCLLQK